MSEHQYYEFRTIDRTLDRAQLRQLRALSSRATITPTRFVNIYDYTDFPGNVATLMDTFFDAHLYWANWGTRELALRFPRPALDPKLLRRYCGGDTAKVRSKGDHVVLHLASEDEDGDGWFDDDEAEGLLKSIVPVRAALAAGDNRALYLVWLLSVCSGDRSDDEVEPPVPAGLGKLTPALKALAYFLLIDGDLIDVAAKAGPSSSGTPSRTVGALRAAAQSRTEERWRREEALEARRSAKREREAAARREKLLKSLAQRGEAPWAEVDTLVATMEPANYDKAVALLVGLKELAVREGRAGVVTEGIRALIKHYTSKQAFGRRARDAGLSKKAG